MRSPEPGAAPPQAFILATDGHFSPIDPANDQVWSLSLTESESSPFTLQTTYNLRARAMQLKPNILVDKKQDHEPGARVIRSVVTAYTPASIQINHTLGTACEVLFECYMPEPDILAGRFQVNNLLAEELSLMLALAAVLSPMGKGYPTRPQRSGGSQVLVGQTEDLYPVLFMTGGAIAISNPFPALTVSLSLQARAAQVINWALVSKNAMEDSLEAARAITASRWQANADQQRMQHARHSVTIRTGSPGWDTAFQLTQVQAMLHQVSPIEKDAGPVFMRSRLQNLPRSAQPEKNALETINELELLHLSQVLLPAQVDLLSRLVENHLSDIVEQNKSVPKESDPLVQPKKDTFPIFTSLCLEIYEINRDKAFLSRVYPLLCELLSRWVDPDQAQPSIQLPEWRHPGAFQLCSGLFTFDMWESTGRGLDMGIVEIPALAAMLYDAVKACQKMAQLTGDKRGQKQYKALAKQVREKFQSFWQDDPPGFHYQDRGTQRTPQRELYYPGMVRDAIGINKAFSEPQRIICHLFSEDEHTRMCSVAINGQNPQGEPVEETFKPAEIRWVMGHAHLTTKNLFSKIDWISFSGLKHEDRFLVENADLEQADITCLLPIWSGGMTEEMITALIDERLDPQDAALQRGIPETWPSRHPLPECLSPQVNVLWNTLILAGLQREGKSQQAADLFTSLMETIVQALRDHQGFFPCYDATSGQPSGHRHALSGLVPIRLFLNIAGIRLFSPGKVACWGSSPFPWPIEVHWQGLSLRREGSITEILFADGSHYRSEDEEPKWIEAKGGQT